MELNMVDHDNVNVRLGRKVQIDFLENYVRYILRIEAIEDTTVEDTLKINTSIQEV